MDFMDRLKAAKRISAPLLTISTTDQPNTAKMIRRFFNPPNAGPDRAVVPIIEWDIVTGSRGMNEEGALALEVSLIRIARVGWTPPEPRDDGTPPPPPPPPMAQEKTKLPVNALAAFQFAPPLSVMVLYNGHNYFGTEAGRDGAAWAYAQALLNQRDTNIEYARMAILLGPDFGNAPSNIVNDLLPLEEPLPTPADLRTALVREIQSYNESNLDHPDEQIAVDELTLVKAVDNLRGVESHAMARQTFAMSITKRGVDTEELWRRNQQLISTCPGLSVWSEVSTYADIEGYDEAKAFYKLVINGRKPIRTVILLDEGEKQTKGADGSDGSSVTTEILAYMLTEMNDRRYEGGIFCGVSGSGKTAMVKAIAGEAGLRLIKWDISGAKGKYVGETNANVRRQFRVIHAISDGAPLIIMTTNSMKNIPTPLLRRFTYGVHFFDSPAEAELQKIWRMYMRKFELVNDVIPESKDWTGSDVERCVRLAWSLNIPLIQAKQYIIPMSESSANEVNAIRLDAVGKYLSASYPGKYKNAMKMPTKKKDSGGRTYQRDGE